jgi:threonylcarbamoyladenosine tRNA methylthiotransferase MtaB
VRLADLVRRLLDETPVERLRLSSVEPMDFSDDLLGLMASSPRIAKHVHAPLQSGSDTVLRRMHRKYRPRHYADRIAKARALMPDCGVGADVMTGFPGETDAEFEDSRAFIASLPFTYLHVFTYSERPGTPAAEREQVLMDVRKHRTHVLRALAAKKNLEFRRSMIGRTLSVVALNASRRESNRTNRHRRPDQRWRVRIRHAAGAVSPCVRVCENPCGNPSLRSRLGRIR